MGQDWDKPYEAPEGKIWVCGACGKSGKNRTTIGDEACFLNAVLCYEQKDLATGNWKAEEE